MLSTPPALYRPHRYPAEINTHAVWLYFRFNLSFRDVEELMAERGVGVSYETIRRWCARSGPAFALQLRQRAATRPQMASRRSRDPHLRSAPLAVL